MGPPRTTAGIAFGGDYNPEQWPEHVWAEDVELMRRAGVDLVTVGVFSWALLEPRPDEFDFGWLDRVIARLDSAGLRVDLATATASPPPWLAALHPETLPVTYDGRRMWPGGRQAFCPSSPVYRKRSLALVRALAERYGRHPALALWHVGNELGGHNVHCYCDISAEAFRQWLRRRYETLDRLNEVWATAFWSQRYGAWEEIWPPRLAPTFTNPTQQLDYRRFSSDELLDNYRREKAVLRQLSPDVPVTTNFMIIEGIRDMDYWGWADEVDVVSNDHYLRAANPDGHIELAFSADLTRGVAGGRPWLLMEHSTSAVNWQPRNVAKAPGEMTRNSLQHVARGADGVLFFQWRASRAGAEKFHSALVPHAGIDTKIFREVVELGGILDRLDEVAGSTVTNDVAMLFDWQCWWAVELDSHPSVDVRYLDRLHAHYRALWEAGIGVDLVHPEHDLTPYRLIIVPALYAVSDTASSRLHDAVARGTTALVTYFSGIVDPNDHVRLGGYPGAFRELLGIRTEEFFPLREGESVRLSDGHTADVWTELLDLRGAQEVASYVDGPLTGVPAVTRHRYGSGTAWYVATRLDRAGVQELTTRLCADAGVSPVAAAPPGVERVRRVAPDASWLFLLNHTDRDVEVPATGQELVTGERADSRVRVPAGGVAVVREAPPHPSLE